jgi:hypothetical protein
VSWNQGQERVVFELLKGSLPEDIYELRDLRIEVPLDRWNRVVKNVSSDRKLLGGLLLDFARNKEKVGGVVSSDRLLGEFRRVVLDATVALVEAEALVLSLAEKSEK